MRAYAKQDDGTLEIINLVEDASGIYTPHGDKLTKTNTQITLLGWPDKTAILYKAMLHDTSIAEYLIP